MQVKKQQLELDMKQWTGSKLRKEYAKAVYCHSVYLTYMQSESEVTQSCPTLCDHMDYSLPGSSVHGILQARILEWVAIPFSEDLPDLGIEPRSLTSPALAVEFFTTSTTCLRDCLFSIVYSCLLYQR